MAFGLIRRVWGKVTGKEVPIVPIIRLSGPIGPVDRFKKGLSIESTADVIAQAFSVVGAKAVAIVINSPGGSPVQSALIMQRIRSLADEKEIPVLAFTEDVAASGGYMIALAADEIFAHEASIVGSIGVVSGGFGFPKALEKLGIERRVYTAGESKAQLDPFQPEKPEEIERLKDLQHHLHEYFKSLVRERRGRRLKSKRGKIFSGDVWIGRQALKMGLVDGIGDVRSVLRERFGEKVVMMPIRPKRSGIASFLRAFGGGAPTIGEGWTAGLGDELLSAVEARLWWNRWGL